MHLFQKLQALCQGLQLAHLILNFTLLTFPTTWPNGLLMLSCYHNTGDYRVSGGRRNNRFCQMPEKHGTNLNALCSACS